MWHWTIRRRIAVAASGVIAVLAVVVVSQLDINGRLRDRTQSLQVDSIASLRRGGALQSTWLDTYRLAQQYILVEDRSSVAPLLDKLRANRIQLDAATAGYEATVYSAEERNRFRRLQQAGSAYLQTEDEMALAGASGRPVSAHTAAELAARVANVGDALDALNEWNGAKASASAAEVLAAMASQRRGYWICTIAFLVSVGLAVFFLGRTIARPVGSLLESTDIVSKGDFTTRVKLDQTDEFGTLATAFNRMLTELTALVDQVQKSAIQVNTSVTQIRATGSEQQATATEIAATTTQIGATSKEISATSKELVNTMNEVSTVAEQAANLAGGGQAGLARMEETMRHVTEAATSISGKLGVLNEKASNINQVVTTITKVADQTNLLSLNAAIEAEKAGDAGRGFAVVATEIRRLADQTAIATYDIEQTVKEIQSAVAAGVMGMDKFSEEVRRGMQEVRQVGEQLTQIIRQVQTLAPRFVAVNEGMQAQATGAEQISDALTQLTESSQQTVQSLRQSNEVIGGLNQVANALRGAVSRFRLA
jgi:methyl-accepting chemotaxis protein WspA